MSQTKKTIELDLPEDTVPVTEEKIIDDESPAAEDAAADEISLDDEDTVPVTEEKIIDDESPAAEDAEDAAADEISLDDEELNPFGDKWEQ